MTNSIYYSPVFILSATRKIPHQEQVGRVAQALDSIRYEDEDIVEYTHTEKAGRKQDIEEDLTDLISDLEENPELQDRWNDYLESLEEFDDIKYDGETESGPGAFITIVDGPKELMEDYASEMPNTNWKNEFGENMPADYQPDIMDEHFPQVVYETMEANDGALVMGENGFSSNMYEIPDVEDMEEELMPKKGGTKHRAAAKAVHSNLKDQHGDEIDVTSIVLSETDGCIRVFEEDGGTEFPYNEQTNERVGDFWKQEPDTSDVAIESGEPLEY